MKLFSAEMDQDELDLVREKILVNESGARQDREALYGHALALQARIDALLAVIEKQDRKLADYRALGCAMA